jgi:hypothetical protein
MKYFLQNEAGDGTEAGAAGDVAPVNTALTQTPAADPVVDPVVDPAAEAPAAEAPVADPVADVDWRVAMAGGDEKKMNQLKRFTDVGKLSEAYFNAQEKIRAGETSNGLPDNPTEEQLTAYREANNVPSTAEDYSLSLDEGLVLGDVDERIMKGVYDIAHKHNVSNDVISDLTNTMLKGREFESQAVTKQDGLDMQQSTSMLRDTWGQDYETNVGLVQGVLGGLPESVRDDFANARMSDGTAVFNSPEMMNFFAEAARAINPAATLVPAGNGNPTQAVIGRIAELEGKMGTNEWYKDTSSQKELQELYTARERLTR